jgi:hypothetical protein
VLKGQCYAPELRSDAEAKRTHSLPTEDKESFSWIVGLRDCMEIAKQLPKTRMISVMDREADFFELFDEQRRNPCVDVLVRAQYNRCTTGDLKLFEAVRQSEVRGQFRIHVKRQSARSKKSKKKARPKRDERIAEVSVRYMPMELSPPVNLVRHVLWVKGSVSSIQTVAGREHSLSASPPRKGLSKNTSSSFTTKYTKYSKDQM